MNIPVRKTISCEYIAIYNLIELIRGRGATEDTEYNPYSTFKTSDILIIDEAGVQYDTDNARADLFALFEYRYNNFKPTIVISNYAIEGTDRQKSLRNYLGQRIMDRLMSGVSKQFHLEGRSMRRRGSGKARLVEEEVSA